MRLNTGRWGTTESFDDLMANKGIEPVLDGYTDEEGFKWVIDAINRFVPPREYCGSSMRLIRPGSRSLPIPGISSKGSMNNLK